MEQEHVNEIELLHDEIRNLKRALVTTCSGRLSSLVIPEDSEASLMNADPPKIDTVQSLESLQSGTDLTVHFDESEDMDAREYFELKGVWQKLHLNTSLTWLELDPKKVSRHMDSMARHSQAWSGNSMSLGPHLSIIPGIRKKCRYFPRAFVVNPGHPSRIAWDLSGMVLISYDMIAIPIHFCFEPEDNIFTTGMGWLTLLFWTIDIATSLCTGYYEEGKLIMNHKMIVKNYVKGWLWVDLIVVVPDWVMKVMGNSTSVAGLGRVLRALRVMRILRLLRIMKLKKILNLVYNLIDSEYMFIVFNLGKLLTLILVLNHMVACAWYLVGRLSKSAGAPLNWLEDIGKTKVYGSSLEWKYLTALHWSITQFTPASMDIYATNVPERIFSIAILFWALVALSSIIGSVSASMTALRNMSSDEMKQFWLLRRYLKQKHISRELSDRIEKFLEFHCVHSASTVEPSKVKLLANVSGQLQLELASEMSAPLLQSHRFFNQLRDTVPTVMFRICHLAIKQFTYASQDIVFQSDEEALFMYFVKSGAFDYKVDQRNLDNKIQHPCWAGEAVLWTNWTHRGLLEASIPSEMVAVNPDEFSKVMRMHSKTWKLGRAYGREFVTFMNLIARSCLTDIVFQFEDEYEHLWDKAVTESNHIEEAIRKTAKCTKQKTTLKRAVNTILAVNKFSGVHEARIDMREDKVSVASI